MTKDSNYENNEYKVVILTFMNAIMMKCVEYSSLCIVE
jgi:hypothetical protein